MPAPILHPLPVYEFTAGGLTGYVRLTDPDRGIQFSQAAEGKVLPALSREVLSLRHYLAWGGGGPLVPREEAPCDGEVEKQSIAFQYGSARHWPLTAAVRYQLLGEGGLDASFTFVFSRRMAGFEAGVETIMPRSQPAIYLRSAGRWVRAQPGLRAQCFYPRNQAAANLIADGRWNGLRMAGISLAVQPQGYDYPLLVVREEKTGWALAYMALTEDCSCLWVNGPQRAIGFGLLGSDVAANSRHTCHLRVVLCPAPKLDDVLSHYRAFVQHARGSPKR